MYCEKCGGKVDKISEDNFFCRKCGARHEIKTFQGISGQGTPVQGTSGRGTSGLLNVVIILNYVTMALLVLFGLFLFLIYAFYLVFFTVLPLVVAGILWWVNGELKKLDTSKRKYTIIANFLVIFVFFFGGIGMSIWIMAYLLVVATIQYYILFLHQPTIAIFA